MYRLKKLVKTEVQFPLFLIKKIDISLRVPAYRKNEAKNKVFSGSESSDNELSKHSFTVFKLTLDVALDVLQS